MTLATAAGNDDQADLAALRDTFETAVAALNTGNLDGFLDIVKHLQQGLIGRNWQAKGASGNPGALLAAFGDELANRHALGHFASDVLLKLGLLGTIVGFILMLIPVGEIEEFDPRLVQQLLSAMSGGMAVACIRPSRGSSPARSSSCNIMFSMRRRLSWPPAWPF